MNERNRMFTEFLNDFKDSDYIHPRYIMHEMSLLSKPSGENLAQFVFLYAMSQKNHHILENFLDMGMTYSKLDEEKKDILNHLILPGYERRKQGLI